MTFGANGRRRRLKTNKLEDNKMQSYKAKNGAQQFKPAQDWIIAAVENDENAGFCLACGDECEGVEPDARRYECDACGAHKVYGAEELMIMGLFH